MAGHLVRACGSVLAALTIVAGGALAVAGPAGAQASSQESGGILGDLIQGLSGGSSGSCGGMTGVGDWFPEPVTPCGGVFAGSMEQAEGEGA